MKNFRIKLLGLLAFTFVFASCDYDNIDSITNVDSGADAGAPEVTITSPGEGNTIKVLEEVASVTIKFEAIDDIELQNIQVMVDGNEIAMMNEFKDYRIVKDEVVFNNVTNGDHTVTVKATDLEGNVTSSTVNFSKEPPYTPKFENEFLYMPFDGDYVDLITLKSADVTGDLSFAGESFLGSNAFTGASDSYITIPFDGSIGSDFTASFWYKVSGEPGRAGILVAGADEERTQGFRLFREGDTEKQRIKLNVGTGDAGVWNDGGEIDVEAGEWVHIAFTVNATESTFYINGMPMNTGDMGGKSIDWTGVEKLTIGSGGETFSYWDHLYDSSMMDELRFFDKSLSQEEVQNLISASAETLHLGFNGAYQDEVSNREITEVGNPGFAGESAEGNNAYAGADGSYLTMSSEGLLSKTFSATFWYKVNATPDRAGIIVIGPEDEENPDAQNNRTSGFRLFREGNETEQRIKLNVGTGAADTWNDGGVIDVAAQEWVYVAFTISEDESKIYLDGELMDTASLPGAIDWTGTDVVSIMSGAPRFTGWGHLADMSFMDNLTFYNKVLTQEDIQSMMGN